MMTRGDSLPASHRTTWALFENEHLSSRRWGGALWTERDREATQRHKPKIGRQEAAILCLKLEHASKQIRDSVFSFNHDSTSGSGTLDLRF